jgi:hypothetical protein
MSLFDDFIFAREEALAAADDPFRDCGSFRLGRFERGVDGIHAGIDEMVRVVAERRKAAEVFFSEIQSPTRFSEKGEYVTFPSVFANGTANDTVTVRIQPAFLRDRGAVIIVPHWNSEGGDYTLVATALACLGFQVYTITLPHHGTRGQKHSQRVVNEFLNADIGAAIRSVQQSVSDLRSLVHWLAST